MMPSVRIALHVTPKSSRDEVAGWRGGELCIKVTAAPEDGKANAAVCKLVAKALGVPKSSARIVRGHTARHKQIEIDGVDERVVHSVLGKPDTGLF